MEVIRIPMAELTPDPNNAKDHPAWQVEQIKRSIEQFGNLDPIGVWGDNNLIVEGHGRFLALQELGYTEAECIRLDWLSDEERRAYALVHNQTTMNTGWLENALRVNLESINQIDMSQFGFEIEPPEVQEDNYTPVLPEDANTKLGQTWQLGRHRLRCGDSTDPAEVEALVDGTGIDMLLTDPPYNVALGKKETVDEARKRHRRTDGLVIMNDEMAEDDFREFLTKAFFNAKAVMKAGAAFHIWHADSEGYNFRGACIDAGLKIRQVLIWVKNQATMGRADFQWMHEPCLSGEAPEESEYEPALYGWKEGAAHRWYKKRKERTVLTFDKPATSKEHPTMKPVLLFDYEMKCNTEPGDAVLDLFGGSGTTVIAAEQNGRTAYVMELDPCYCDVIIDRWEKLTGEKAVLVNE